MAITGGGGAWSGEGGGRDGDEKESLQTSFENSRLSRRLSFRHISSTWHLGAWLM